MAYTTEQEMIEAVERDDVEFVLAAYRNRGKTADHDFRGRLVTALLTGAAASSAGHTAEHIADRALEIADAVIKKLGEVP